MEKIIQLPFCLPEPPPEKIKTFIANSIRPYEVDILYVARRLKTFLKCIKSFIDDDYDLKSKCQDVSKALRKQLCELSSEKEIKVELQK